MCAENLSSGLISRALQKPQINIIYYYHPYIVNGGHWWRIWQFSNLSSRELSWRYLNQSIVILLRSKHVLSLYLWKIIDPKIEAVVDCAIDCIDVEAIFGFKARLRSMSAETAHVTTRTSNFTQAGYDSDSLG